VPGGRFEGFISKAFAESLGPAKAGPRRHVLLPVTGVSGAVIDDPSVSYSAR
jgi:hypothetical protein